MGCITIYLTLKVMTKIPSKIKDRSIESLLLAHPHTSSSLSQYTSISQSHTHIHTLKIKSIHSRTVLFPLVLCQENSSWQELQHICFECSKAESNVAYRL